MKKFEPDFVTSESKYLKISPRKVAVVLDLVRGERFTEAQRILTFNRSKAAKLILKTLKAAGSNASNNKSVKPETLYISKALANGGPLIRSGRIVGKSRTSPLIKRTSHILIGLSEAK